ncbi:MAG: CarD family transcriptional regulator [Clostridia bacterium]|nr:CarD family transcriptional regulator [Clostridia bacterium]
MYNIGDKIVYPMHGAGVIESIEEKMILGKKQSYYVMKMTLTGEMTVMIPMQSCDEIGVRFVIEKEEGAKVLEAFRAAPVEDSGNWNKRHRDNMQKIKSGDIYQVLNVVKELMYRDKAKGLSTSERKMLNNAKQIMVSELVLSKVAGRNDIESIMCDSVDELFEAR